MVALHFLVMSPCSHDFLLTSLYIYNNSQGWAVLENAKRYTLRLKYHDITKYRNITCKRVISTNKDNMDYKFCAKNTGLSTLPGLRQEQHGVITLPPVLKTLSDAQLVAQTDRYFWPELTRSEIGSVEPSTSLKGWTSYLEKAFLGS